MAVSNKIKERVNENRFVKKLSHRTQEIYVPGFNGFSLFQVGHRFIQQLKRTSLIERAAAISFNVFMAIPPVLIFFFTLIPYLPISDKVIEELYSLIRDIVPGRNNNQVIIDFLDDFLKNPRNDLLSFGLFLALFFSSNAMMGVLRSFDKDYEGFLKRKGLRKRQKALQLMMVVLTLVFLCLLLLIAQGAVLQWIGVRNEILRAIISNARWAILVLIIFYIVSYIYRHGPALERRWPFITPGSVLATLFMVIATLLFSYYVNNFNNYNKLYGSISAVFILMILIYVNALVLLLGFELNVTINSMISRRNQRLQSNQENPHEDR